MSDSPFDIADRLVDDVAALMPTVATQLGIPGHDHEWDDFSPAGAAQIADLARRYRKALEPHMQHEQADQRHAARVVDAFLVQAIEDFELGEHLRHLNHVESPLRSVRVIFDVMDKGSEESWENICRRLAKAGEALAGYEDALEAGLRSGLVVSKRQVQSVVEQAQHLAGPQSAWNQLVAELSQSEFSHLGSRLEESLVEGKKAAADLGTYLEQGYLPNARDDDGVGEERYLTRVDRFLGMQIDPKEVYGWGWEEVTRLMAEMERVSALIDRDRSLEEVITMLEHDPAYSAPDPQTFIDFVQERQDQALLQLDGTHFDVPAQIRNVTVNLVPPGGALGAYYLQPTEDFSRPGGIWYSLGDKEVIPLWQEVSTAYHEGFPGHHLQIGTSMCQAERLSRAHRLLVWYSGYGEGWALYTERLMDELGYFERPDYLLGMLASQLFRACRVVVDIGCHLGYQIPEHAPLFAGEGWTFETAVEYMRRIGLQDPAVAESEVLRYLGWPGQAISYKVGEREILALRDEVRRRQGEAFDLREFHTKMLIGGEMRLDYLREVILG